MSDLTKERERAKILLLEKLKNLKISSEGAPSVASFSSNHPTPVQRPDVRIRDSNTMNEVSRKKQPEKKLLAYDDHQQSSSKREDPEQQKGQNQRDPKKSTRIKKPYYEHYVKEGEYVPVLQYVRNHKNPSGKPSNIPPQLQKGIVTVPKRPWVYFGPENIPASDCQQINQKTFSAIFDQAKKMKGSGVFKKSNKKKGGRRNEDEISEVSEEFTSNFTFSDSVDLSKESDLISEFRTQTKALKNYDSGNVEESQAEYDFSSISGSTTQKHRYNLFDSSESEEQKESKSIEVAKRRHKFKKLIQSSDEEPSKSSMNKGNSFQASEVVQNASSSQNPRVISSKGSSGRVQIDEAESSISKSKSKSKSKGSVKAVTTRRTRNKKPRQLDSDDS